MLFLKCCYSNVVILMLLVKFCQLKIRSRKLFITKIAFLPRITVFMQNYLNLIEYIVCIYQRHEINWRQVTFQIQKQQSPQLRRVNLKSWYQIVHLILLQKQKRKKEEKSAGNQHLPLRAPPPPPQPPHRHLLLPVHQLQKQSLGKRKQTMVTATEEWGQISLWGGSKSEWRAMICLRS